MNEIVETAQPTNATATAAATASILLCPACECISLQRENGRLACTTCLAVLGNAATPESIVDLRIDPEQDTALDLETYDAAHGITTSNSTNVFRTYDQLINKYGRSERGRVLEIGAGTGNLTFSLVSQGGFHEAHISDLSPGFLNRLSIRCADVAHGKRIHFYLFNADVLPFKDECFDVVVGHSILHHLLNFEQTIAHAHRVLKPGGVAIFGEPMLEARALVSLAADFVLKVDAERAKPTLAPETVRIMNAIIAQGRHKLENLVLRPERVATREDKFIFPAPYLRKLSAKTGFAAYHLVHKQKNQPISDFVLTKLQDFGVGRPQVQSDLVDFLPLIKGLLESYQGTLGNFIDPPFGMNVFVKSG